MATKPKVQFISTPRGDDLAVLPRKDYEALLAASGEDAGDARDARAAIAALKRGDEIAMPAEQAARIMAGESAIRVLREWRGVSQGALAKLAGIGQGYLSDIEAGRRKGPSNLHVTIAEILAVPVSAILL